MDPKKDEHSSGSKPWDQSFADDRDDQGNLSRTKRHRQSHNNRLITIILVAIIILIAVGSLIYGLARQSAMNKPDNSMSVSEQTSSSQSTTHKKAAKAASEKAASSTKADSKSDSVAESASSVKAARASSKQAARVSEQQTTQAQSTQQTTTSSASSSAAASSTKRSTSSTKSTGSKYATVGQGQGMYRVAVNNGISVEKLKELNGLSGNATLTPGQKLRVK